MLIYVQYGATCIFIVIVVISIHELMTNLFIVDMLYTVGTKMSCKCRFHNVLLSCCWWELQPFNQFVANDAFGNYIKHPVTY